MLVPIRFITSNNTKCLFVFPNWNEHKWSSLFLISIFLSMQTHRRTLALVVHTPLVKKGSTRRCSSTHISIHSFICSFSLAFSIFISLWHTHTQSVSIRRNRLFFVTLPWLLPSPSSRLPIPLFSIPFSSSFTIRATIYRKKVQNTVRESLLHTHMHTLEEACISLHINTNCGTIHFASVLESTA